MSAGVVAIPAMISAVARAWTATQVFALDDILYALLPAHKPYHRVGGTPDTDCPESYEAR